MKATELCCFLFNMRVNLRPNLYFKRKFAEFFVNLKVECFYEILMASVIKHVTTVDFFFIY